VAYQFRFKADELPHFVRWEDSSKVLSKADVVIITGVTLINDTLEPILRMVREEAEVAVMGPTKYVARYVI